MRPRLLAVMFDLIVILVFATIGRISHADGLTVPGVLATAWPFVVGAWLGHLAVGLRKGAEAIPASLSAGMVAWVCAVIGGMALRQVTGAGTDPAFVLVATLVLGGLLLGWRLLSRQLLPQQPWT